MTQEDLPNPELLSLTLNCLHGLSTLNLAENLVKAVFELRATCLAGYMPDLSGCHVCGNEEPDLFDITAGSLECAKCRIAGAEGLRFPVNSGIVAAMRYIAFCDPKKLFAFQLGEENVDNLSHLTEAYLTRQLERGFTTLDFYKSLYI